MQGSETAPPQQLAPIRNLYIVVKLLFGYQYAVSVSGQETRLNPGVTHVIIKWPVLNLLAPSSVPSLLRLSKHLVGRRSSNLCGW